MKEIVYKKILEFFDGDVLKTNLWFSTRNDLLGGVTPNSMLLNGNVEKLLWFINEQKSLNEHAEKIQFQKTYSGKYENKTEKL